MAWLYLVAAIVTEVIGISAGVIGLNAVGGVH
jgi:hypothetical protein